MTGQDSDAYRALLELRAAYARAIDYGQWEEYAQLFTTDTEVVYPRETLNGRQAVYEYGRDRVEYEYSMHTAQMPELEIDGNTASGEWYMLVFYIATDGTQGHVLGSYTDEYRRVDGSWKFDRMVATVAHDTGGYHKLSP
ncbi:nuclear transport factor 2 family protein [Natronosalvus amylolyticus]|uniref:nuclear transport factor 2 family protein n=1 Tax=Natronosalvus amylolyticus TaxID=2961994 RepID=UPI0020C98AEE|nr:nuclear transport factor 2 family protein [Natronosalvus amylolyticus]